jgi:hypothetical protein
MIGRLLTLFRAFAAPCLTSWSLILLCIALMFVSKAVILNAQTEQLLCERLTRLEKEQRRVEWQCDYRWELLTPQAKGQKL